MFGRTQINMAEIIPTSKMTLKMSCIRACNNDVTKAAELYEFLIKDIGSLPDFDIKPPTTFEQIRGMAGDIFGWVEQNQDKLVGAFNFIQNLRGGAPIGPTAGPPVGVAPIPD